MPIERHRPSSNEVMVFNEFPADMFQHGKDGESHLNTEQVARLVHELRTHQIELELQNEELRHAQEELLDSRNRYTELYDFAPVGYVTVDDKGIIEKANLTFADMVSTERRELDHCPFTRYLSDTDQRKHYLCRRRLLDSRERQTCEVRLKRKDGAFIDACLDYVVSADIDGGSGRYRVCVTDISQRKTVEAERKKLASELQQAQKMQALGTLSGGIAHEFNNLISIIIGSAELAQIRVHDEPVLQDHLKRIMQASGQAKDLVQKILAFARTSKSKLGPINLREVLADAMFLMETSLPAAIVLQKPDCTENYSVMADPSEIHQIVVNLCSNAIHAMKDNGTLSLDLERSDSPPEEINLPKGTYAVLSVTDTGHGMDAQTQSRIFEPFFTTKSIGEGTGMGLAIAYGMMQRYHGAISVNSEPGRGSTFRLYFPLVENTLLVEPQGACQEVVSKGERILLVEDDPMVAEVTKESLKYLGHTVTLETSSPAALERFRERPFDFDLIITDHGMPFMTGDQLARACLQTRPDIPIILYTGNVTHIDEQRAKDLGIRGFALKPLLRKDLARLIEQVLAY